MSGIEAAFGVAAGGAGLLSLALQLGETAVKLKKIFNSMKNAPRTISRLAFHLETMGIALHRLEQYRQQDVHSDTLLVRCITECQDRTSDIQHLVGKMDQCMMKYEKLGGRVYTAFKEREMKELLEELDRAKSSLELAYAMYFTTKQMQRDETYNSTLNQQGTLLSNLKVEIRSGNANTSQQLSSLLQFLTTSSPTLRTKPERRSTTSFEQDITGMSRNNEHASRLHNSSVAKHSSSELGKHRKLISLQLRSWFSRQIWELAIYKAYCRWSMHFSTYSIVPYDSKIFYCAKIGDTVGIQRVIERGEGSLLDVSYNGWCDETLIEAASRSGQLEVCRYLLRETTWPDQARTLNNALDWYNTESPHVGEKAVEMYRMVAKTPGFDADLEDTSIAYGWLETCKNMQCLNLVLEHQAWNFAHLSVQARFELALQITRSSIDCSELLRFIGLRPTDKKLASLKSSSGRSLLHYIARRITACHTSSGLEAWLDLGVNIVKSGTDLFSIAQRESRDHIGPFGGIYCYDKSQQDPGRTPFMELIGIRLWGIDMDGRSESLLKDIRNWAKMMQRAGIDLRDYGNKEDQIWKSLGSKDHAVFERRESDDTCPPARIEQVVFGPRPADWSLIYRRYISLHVFKQKCMPGTYPKKCELPTTAIWCPTEEEEKDSPWEAQPRIVIVSAQKDLRNRCVQEEAPFAQLIDGTQDDSGAIMLMQYRISPTRGSESRSHSQPPSIQRTEMSFGEWPRNRRWLGHYHKCPFDSQWRSSCARITREQDHTMVGDERSDLRSCVEGVSISRSVSFQESKEWRLRSYLADIARCQDRVVPSRYRYKFPKEVDHTQDRSCPWGCSKVDLSRLRVPEALRKFHPTRSYKEE